MIVISQIWRHCFVFRSCLCVSHSKGRGGGAPVFPLQVTSFRTLRSVRTHLHTVRMQTLGGSVYFLEGSVEDLEESMEDSLRNAYRTIARVTHTHTAFTLLSETKGDCFHGHQGHDQRHPSLSHRYAGSVVTRCVRTGLAFLQESAFNQACH